MDRECRARDTRSLVIECHTAIIGHKGDHQAQTSRQAARSKKRGTHGAVSFTLSLYLMHPSAQTLVLTLAALAASGAQGFRFHRRADPVDNSNSQGLQNILVTNAQQTSFYIPMQFGSGSGAANLLGLISTVR